MNYVAGQNLNFAVSSKHLIDLLKEAGGFSRPWWELPAPRPDPDALVKAEEDHEKLLADQRARAAAEAMAAAIRESQDKQISNQSLQEELNRIVARAGDITRAISVIEVEGTALTQRRGQIFAAAEGIVARGKQVENQIGALEYDLLQCQALLSLARYNQLDDRIALRQAQITEIEAQLYDLAQEHSTLQGQMVILDREARELAGQIDYKATQRDQLVNELQALRQRYDEIKAQ